MKDTNELYREVERMFGADAVSELKRRTSKREKIKICLQLDADTVRYFKRCADEQDMGYQVLINRTLRELVDRECSLAEAPVTL